MAKTQQEFLVAWLNDAHATEKALILAAREVGDEQTAQVCESILRDEEEMARWVDQNLPMALREVLHREAEPQTAR
jgi:ferritin-like metal-binding protein YciE